MAPKGAFGEPLALVLHENHLSAPSSARKPKSLTTRKSGKRCHQILPCRRCSASAQAKKPQRRVCGENRPKRMRFNPFRPFSERFESFLKAAPASQCQYGLPWPDLIDACTCCASLGGPFFLHLAALALESRCHTASDFLQLF